MSRPLGGIGAGRLYDPLPKRHDQADLLRKRYEFIRRDQSPFGVMPPHKGLERRYQIILQVDDGLVIDLELLASECSPQSKLQRSPGAHAGIHFRLEETVLASAICLGAMERHVRILQQIVGVVAVVRADRDPDAPAQQKALPRDLIRFANYLDQSHGQGRSLLSAGKTWLNDRKLVSSKARRGIDIANSLAEPF